MGNKIFRFFKKNWILLLILASGLFLRVYKPLELFMYDHDQDLLGWFIRDVVVNHHIRFIGQETSSGGVFIGPLFYYLQTPFYLLFRMDPAGGLVMPVVLGVFTIFSLYFVFSKVFSKRIGLTAALIYSFSYLIIFTDRKVVPTMPVILWTVWFFYFLWKLTKGKVKSYFFLGLLLGLAWNFSMGLMILTPLIILAQIIFKKTIPIKPILLGILVFMITMTPFFVFEIRHGFTQTKSIAFSLTTQKDLTPGTGQGFAKLDRVMQLVHNNTSNLFWNPEFGIQRSIIFYLLLTLFILLIYKKKISFGMAVIMFLWQVLYIAFFSTNSINTSEYYLDGMNIIWIAIVAIGIDQLFSGKRFKHLGYLAISVFIFLNIWRLFTMNINRSGYVERKNVVSFISNDSKAHGYPCVSVSYITSAGSELGYRYFFWLTGLHVNQPKSGSPVYTIVYPLSKVEKLDRTFGALGLVLPDYARYTKKNVDVSCSGADANLTDPLFGFTN
jgi:hypothetical protein